MIKVTLGRRQVTIENCKADQGHTYYRVVFGNKARTGATVEEVLRKIGRALDAGQIERAGKGDDVAF